MAGFFIGDEGVSERSNLKIQGETLGGFVEDAHIEAVVNDEGVGLDAVHDEDVAADGAVGADDGFAAEDGGAGIDGDVVFDGGVAFFAAQLLATGGGAGSQGDAVIHFHVFADDGGFAHDGAGAVVHKEIFPDARAGMQVHAGAAVRPLGHDAREERDVFLIELVGEALDGDGFDEGIGDDDFVPAGGGGVAIESGFDVGLEDFAQLGEAVEKGEGQAMGFAGDVSPGEAVGRVVFKAFADFVFEGAEDGVHERGGFGLELAGVDEVFVEKAGEEEAEEVAGEGGDDAFGGQVFAVQMVDAAGFGIGGQEPVGDMGHRFHGVNLAGNRRGTI